LDTLSKSIERKPQSVSMRKLLPLLVVSLGAAFSASSQCSTASLNWDALDYLPTSGYSNTTAQNLSPNQYFAFGKNRLNITYSGCTSVGENATHTGSTGSYGAGEDVQFTGNGTITLTFTTAVSNLKFSVYDIDKGQTIAITALNSGVSTPVTVAKANTSSTAITITGSIVTSNTGNESEGTNTTSVNVDVAGPVTSVTLTVTNSNTRNGGSADSDYWLSDIEACVTGTFPSGYYQVSRPYTGMPAYVLVAANKGVYMVDPATGKAKLIFTDGATSGTINSLAYDPYNKIIYYCWSLTNNGSANASGRELRKYDFATGVTAIVNNDVRTFGASTGIPTFDQGVESGAAAFYDGALYLGIEGGADNGAGGPRSTTTGRESIIWRIEFDGSGVPVSATQVFGTNGDTHDWSDFSINNGMLYDLNGESGGAHYQHVNLQTGTSTRVNYSGVAPKQSAVGWDGTVYWVSNQIGRYNLDGTVGTLVSITSNPAIPNWGTTGAPSFGDGAEAFRPKADFGDAPNSYDGYAVDTLSPALHEISANLRLGASLDDEWNKPAITSANATEDGSDEDGLAYVRIFVNGANYQTDLRVYNNTGANATVCAWLDFNNDGQFQAGEGISQTIATSTTTQNVSLLWPSPVSTLPNNSYSYLRIRITSAANGMTVSNPTGYFGDGEVEDYYVFVSNTPLEVKLADFMVKKINEEKVSLAWSVTDEEPDTRYELQKSKDGQVWSALYSRAALSKNEKASYECFDLSPYSGTNHYRLKITKPDGGIMYSTIKKVVMEKQMIVQIVPNPSAGSARLSVQSEQRASAHIRIVDMNGRAVYELTVVIEEGTNGFTLPLDQLLSGVYQAEVWVDTRRYTQQLIVKK
jgi:hypothetical protein